MTKQLALDHDTNDLILGPTGFLRVEDGRYTVQLVKTRLQTILGESIISPRIGWLNLDDVGKNYDLFDIELRATEIILSTKGVKSVTDINLRVINRELLVDFTADTIYGEINTSVAPWRVL